jgi:hypothetical protein
MAITYLCANPRTIAEMKKQSLLSAFCALESCQNEGISPWKLETEAAIKSTNSLNLMDFSSAPLLSDYVAFRK